MSPQLILLRCDREFEEFEVYIINIFKLTPQLILLTPTAFKREDLWFTVI